MNSEQALQKELSEALEKSSVQEAAISRSVAGIYDTITHPSVIIKECIRDLAADKDLRSDVGKLAVHALARGFTGSKTKGGFLARIIPPVISFFFRK
jgi:hypothetical protein